MSEVNEPSNDEATELEKLILAGKPWLEQNGTLLIYGLAAVLAIAAIFVYFNRQPSGNTAASRDLLVAVSPEEFRDVADAYPDLPIGTWARLRQADRLLDDSVTSVFTNREEGMNLLTQAEAAYKRLEDRSDIDDQLRERVLIGLARVAEVNSDGSEEKASAATAAWERVVEEYPKSIVKEHAESRIARLATAESRSFYKWFHEQNPAPVDPGLSPGQPAVPELPATMSPFTSKEEGKEEPTTEAAAEEVPTKDAPAKEVPTKEVPTKEVPTKDAPAKEAPAKEVPAKEVPAKEVPAKEVPAKEVPAKEVPAKDAPAKDAPAKDAPAKDAPAKDAPAKDAPAKDAPAKDAPAKDAPAKEAPPVEDPAK